jgi:hypothetical protein
VHDAVGQGRAERSDEADIDHEPQPAAHFGKHAFTLCGVNAHGGRMILRRDKRANAHRRRRLRRELLPCLRPTQEDRSSVMTQKSYRGGEGRNATPRSPERGSPELPKQRGHSAQQGITRTDRGEDQPADKARAQQVHKGERESDGEKAQREAAERQPMSPGEPAGHE